MEPKYSGAQNYTAAYAATARGRATIAPVFRVHFVISVFGLYLLVWRGLDRFTVLSSFVTWGRMIWPIVRCAGGGAVSHGAPAVFFTGVSGEL